MANMPDTLKSTSGEEESEEEEGNDTMQFDLSPSGQFRRRRSHQMDQEVRGFCCIADLWIQPRGQQRVRRVSDRKSPAKVHHKPQTRYLCMSG